MKWISGVYAEYASGKYKVRKLQNTLKSLKKKVNNEVDLAEDYVSKTLVSKKMISTNLSESFVSGLEMYREK